MWCFIDKRKTQNIQTESYVITQSTERRDREIALIEACYYFIMNILRNLPRPVLTDRPDTWPHDTGQARSLSENKYLAWRGLCSSAGCWAGKCCGWLRSPLLRSLVLIWGLCEILKQSWEDVAGDKKQHIAATLGTSVLFFVNSVCQSCSSITLIWWHFFTWFPFPQFPGSTSK